MSNRSDTLPDGLLVSWYGDDFTGSAAAMEVLSLAGLPAVLFFDVPTPELLARFSDCRGIGIAGVARSKSPQWMESALPPVFNALAQYGAPIIHYKVCSTLDSAPHVGSIGKAIDVAQRRFSSDWIPLVFAAPAIHRYQLFANLFATVDGEGFRLDRHPTMSRHPVTPMTEADVRLHLKQQTHAPIGLIDCLALRAGRAEKVLKSELGAGHRLIAIDVLDDETLIAAGRLIWEHRGDGLFAVGSQGIEYALVAYWRSAGMIDAEYVRPQAKAVKRIAVVSGSCSPVTDRQIEWAEAQGFDLIRLDVQCALDDRAWSHARAKVTQDTVRAIGEGRDAIVFSARGPDDPCIAKFFEAVDASGLDLKAVHETIGCGLGQILHAVFKQTGVRRGVLAGGDTSSHAAKALGVQALTLAGATVPGAALFRAHSDDPLYPDLEIALKGGQMGTPDYFGQIKNGGVAASR